MKTLFTFLLLLSGLMLLDVSRLSAQNQVSILEAERIEGGTVDGQKVRKIIGNVHLKLAGENLEMFCDSAWQFINNNEIRAYGNIQVNTRDEKIWADTLIYFTDVDFSQLRGRVIIEADSTTLFGQSIDYRFSTKVAHFIDDIRLEDPEGILSAESGFYYRQADSAVFRGQVQLQDSLQYIEGDSLFTNRASKYYEMYGDIFANDRENNTVLKGDYLEADSTGRRLLRGNAWLRNVEKRDSASAPDTTITPSTSTPSRAGDDTLKAGQPERPYRPDSLLARPDSLVSPDPTPAADTSPDTLAEGTPDTTHIRALKIRSTEYRTPADTSSVIEAYENVRIWSPKFSAVADTSRYSERTETFELWSKPKAWHNNVQLSGPYIRAKLNEGNIEKLVSHPEPFAVQEDTAIGRLNQMTADTLTAYFEGGNLSQIFLEGNTHLLQFTKNEAGEPDGANELTAPTTRIFFEEGDLVRLKALGPVSGSYLPESQQTAERRLEGFVWTPDIRPVRPETQMTPRFAPIPEERPFELPRRYKQYMEKKKAR